MFNDRPFVGNGRLIMDHGSSGSKNGRFGDLPTAENDVISKEKT